MCHGGKAKDEIGCWRKGAGESFFSFFRRFVYFVVAKIITLNARSLIASNTTMKPNFLLHLLAAALAIFPTARAQVADDTNAAVPSISPAPSARPSIIFVQCHGLGYGDLSSYGQKLFQTPNLDQLAAEGVRCMNYFAGNIGITPSPGVLMFGKTSAPENGEPTIAQRLQSAGYRTGLIGEWGLGDEPWKQGFDEFAGFIHDDEGRNYFSDFIWRYAPNSILDFTNNRADAFVGRENIHANTGGQKGRYLPEILINATCAFIKNNQPDQFNGYRPFFLLVNLPVPRSARADADEFTVPSDAPFSDEKWPQAAKNRTALIARLDNQIGRISAQLVQSRLTNNVIFIFASAAPPEKFANTNLNFLLPNGTAVSAQNRAAAPLPFIVRWPGTIPAQQTNTLTISAADFLPTALEIARQKAPEGLSGHSLLPVFIDGEKAKKAAESAK